MESSCDWKLTRVTLVCQDARLRGIWFDANRYPVVWRDSKRTHTICSPNWRHVFSKLRQGVNVASRNRQLRLRERKCDITRISNLTHVVVSPTPRPPEYYLLSHGHALSRWLESTQALSDTHTHAHGHSHTESEVHVHPKTHPPTRTHMCTQTDTHTHTHTLTRKDTVTHKITHTTARTQHHTLAHTFCKTHLEHSGRSLAHLYWQGDTSTHKPHHRRNTIHAHTQSDTNEQTHQHTVA